VMSATAGIARIPKAFSLYRIRSVAYAQLANSEAESDFTTAAELEPTTTESASSSAITAHLVNPLCHRVGLGTRRPFQRTEGKRCQQVG
jgi:hypothetical protein